MELRLVIDGDDAMPRKPNPSRTANKRGC